MHLSGSEIHWRVRMYFAIDVQHMIREVLIFPLGEPLCLRPNLSLYTIRVLPGTNLRMKFANPRLGDRRRLRGQVQDVIVSSQLRFDEYPDATSLLVNRCFPHSCLRCDRKSETSIHFVKTLDSARIDGSSSFRDLLCLSQLSGCWFPVLSESRCVMIPAFRIDDSPRPLYERGELSVISVRLFDIYGEYRVFFTRTIFRLHVGHPPSCPSIPECS
jgi:hypothetical protein